MVQHSKCPSLRPLLKYSYLYIYSIFKSFKYVACPDPAKRILVRSKTGMNIWHTRFKVFFSLRLTCKHSLSSPLSIRVILGMQYFALKDWSADVTHRVADARYLHGHVLGIGKVALYHCNFAVA